METPNCDNRNLKSPYGWSIGGEYERSEYKYPVVLHQHVSSFINIEDMLFEVGIHLVDSKFDISSL